jgi:3-oxoacyl-[acyl-carrier-protein] synthase II
MRPVAITGVGLVSPLGFGAANHLAGLMRQTCGLRVPQDEQLLSMGVPGVGSVAGDAPWEMDRVEWLGLLAARQALQSAGLAEDDIPEDCYLSLASSKGAVLTLFDEMVRGTPENPVYGRLTAECPGLAVARALSLRGPVTCRTAACATGLVSIIAAAREVASGRSSIALAGAAESSLNPLMHAAFANMGALTCGGSGRHLERRVQPFDCARSGFLLGEGAGVVVLESPAGAGRRGAPPLAFLIGGGQSCDAYSMASPDPEGRGVTAAVRQALSRAGVAPGELSGVWAHGTGTRDGDASESRGLSAALVNAGHGVAVTASKGLTGHLLGASGAVELAMAAMCLDAGWLPGIANFTSSDCCAPPLAMSSNGRYTRGRSLCLVVSAGFGGHVASAVLSADETYCP